MNTRRADARVLALLLAATYAVPARLRPALGLAVAVGLSRAHHAGYRRELDAIVAAYNERKHQVTPRVDDLERRLIDIEVASAGPRPEVEAAWQRIRARFPEDLDADT